MNNAFKHTLIAATLALPMVATAADFSRYVDANGGISRPENFRTEFVHLGSYAVLDEKSAARGLHDVYTEKATVEHYRKTGQFPDGATLVKEIRQLQTGAMTTGNPVAWGASPAVWFVMIKDSQGRFAGNPLWGDGWGWAQFTAASPARNTAASYKTDCLGCHLPAARTDHVFVQGYPTLSPH